MAAIGDPGVNAGADVVRAMNGPAGTGGCEGWALRLGTTHPSAGFGVGRCERSRMRGRSNGQRPRRGQRPAPNLTEMRQMALRLDHLLPSSVQVL